MTDNQDPLPLKNPPQIKKTLKASSVPSKERILSFKLNPRLAENIQIIDSESDSTQDTEIKSSSKQQNSNNNDNQEKQIEKNIEKIQTVPSIQDPTQKQMCKPQLTKYVRTAQPFYNQTVNINQTTEENNIERINKSKQIQDEYNTQDQRNKIFEMKIKDNIHIFSCDKYLYFIVQLIIEKGPIGHKQWVFESVYTHRHQVITDAYGYRIFSKCLIHSKNDSNMHFKQFTDFILDEQEHNITPMFYDKYATYTVQKCMELLDNQQLEQLLVIVKKQLSYVYKLQNKRDLCFDQFGCLILQKLVEIFNKLDENSNIQQQINKMLNQIINLTLPLSQKQYSNYIIQQILEKGSQSHKKLLEQKIINPQNFIKLSLDKYGSNVIERIVIFSDQSQREAIWKILEKNYNNHLLDMVNNIYANYVVQQIYSISSEIIQKEIGYMVSLWYKEGKLNEDSGLHVYNYIMNHQNSQNFNNNQIMMQQFPPQFINCINGSKNNKYHKKYQQFNQFKQQLTEFQEFQFQNLYYPQFQQHQQQSSFYYNNYNNNQYQYQQEQISLEEQQRLEKIQKNVFPPNQTPNFLQKNSDNQYQKLNNKSNNNNKQNKNQKKQFKKQ